MLYLEETRDGSIKINLTRGDDAVIEVPLQNIDEEEYVLGEDEYLIFDVRAVPREDSELLVHITSNPGSNRIVFTHEDTVNLEPGQYSSEIQMMTSDGKRVTVWPKPIGKYKTKDTANRKNFILMPEVVYT